MRRSVATALIALAIVGAVSGCGAAPVDKQGAPRPAEAVTLRVGVADPTDPAFEVFVGAVADLSHRRVRLDVDRTTYFSQTPGGEVRLARDLQAGRVDLAYLPSRDWAATGDPGFRALQAPFLLSTTAATVAVARSEVSGELLRGMARHQAVGLGLVPAEPRRLVTRAPVLDPGDLVGAALSIRDSDQTAAMLSALGADPVQGMTDGVRQALESGALDGVETSPRYVGENSYQVAAPFLTSFALVPKFEVIAASANAWGALSEDDRTALDSAADTAAEREATKLATDEAGELDLLCRHGLVLVEPSTATLNAVVAAAATTAPTDDDARQVIASITSRVAGTGPQVLASAPPPSCRPATSIAQAEAQAGTTATAPSGPPAIPAGTYVVTVTAGQFRAAGAVGTDFAKDVTFTWVLRPDGTFAETQVPDYPDQGPLRGRYVVDGQDVTLTYDVTPTGTPAPETTGWSFYAGRLTFTDLRMQDPAARAIYQQPWIKTS